MDSDDLGCMLDKILIGDQKLYVNLPRFQRGKGDYQRDRVPALTKGTNVVSQPRRDRRQAVSYAQAMQGGANKDRVGGGLTEKGLSNLCFDVDNVDVKRYASLFVGKVHTPGITYDIQEKFHDEGYFRVKATPMGANLVLLEGGDDGEIPALINDVLEWLHTWFHEVRCWSPAEMDREILFWVQCTGVPVHTWSEGFFRFIVTSFGEFVNFDEDTRK